MARTGRPGLLLDQKSELWRRWKAGETLSDIGRALGKHAASVFGIVAAKGGFAPLPRSRKSGSLSFAEREEISRGLVEGRSFRQLGRDLRRAGSTISREVAINGGRHTYRAIKRFHYDDHDQLRQHLANCISAYNFGRRLKTLKGLTPYEFICKQWTIEPEQFTLNRSIKCRD